jgi:hypothetical protein
VVNVAPGRAERVKGVSEPIVVHRLLEIKGQPPVLPA